MEFNLIKKYFTWESKDKSIITNIGDDCAIIKNSKKLAISTDTLISDIHFFADTLAKDIAYKALAVNLSDLAAMGATPKYFTLALSLPNLDEKWLKEFSISLKNLAQAFNIALIGGDTTKGILSITITIIGECENPLTRSHAQVGDAIFVSGKLGGAKLALEQIKQSILPNSIILQQLNNPFPQIKLGQKLIKIATSCIDISDGLLADLGHILQQSNVGANLDSKKIPIFSNSNLNYALYGGDDYQLCFTANKNKVLNIENITQIGVITQNLKLKIDNKIININDKNGYLHF